MFDGLMDGFDPRKAAQLVDDLWDDRHRIVDAVSFVADQRDELLAVVRFVKDHGDDVLGVVDFVRDHGEDLIDFVKRLPDFLGDVGDGMQAAGSTATRAANFLGGDGDDANEGGVMDLANFAAEAFEAVQGELEVAVKLLGRLGEELTDLAIPSIEAEYTEVVGLRVISGLDIGRSHPAAGAAKEIVDGGERLGAIAGQVSEAASKVRELGVRIGDMGSELGGAGEELSSSGLKLASFESAKPTGAKAIPRKRSAKKTATRKRPSARKKAATKKKAATRKRPAADKKVTKKVTKKVKKKASPKKAAAKKRSPRKQPAKQATFKKAAKTTTPKKKASRVKR